MSWGSYFLAFSEEGLRKRKFLLYIILMALSKKPRDLSTRRSQRAQSLR